MPDDVMVNLILNALKDQEAKMTSGRSGIWLNENEIHMERAEEGD